MTRLEKYRQQHAETRQKMEAILTAAEATDGVLTDAQSKDYDGLKATLTAAKAKIEREEQLAAEELAAPAVRRIGADGAQVRDVKLRADADPARGFRGPRDFLMAAMKNRGAYSRDVVADERLRPLAVDGGDGMPGVAFLLPRAFNPGFLAAAGSDEQGVYDDRYGGHLVQPTLLPRMFQLGFEGDPTIGRTQPIPMASPTVKIPARTDKNHATSVSGGLTVTRRPETVAATASRAEMELITLTATGLFGLAYATEEILTDSPISFVAIIESGFRDQFAHALFREKLRGLSGAELLGVIASDCTVAETRDTSTRILGDDVIQMRARCWGYDQAIWLANHDCYPELVRLGAAAYDVLAATPLAGSNALYQQSLQEDRPDRLLGRPIFYSEYPSTLGGAGDLILGNWSQYLEGLYQPIQSAESMHVRFVEHERAFKFWLRNCGAPWWRSALTPNQSTATLSPFVILAA